MGNIEGHSSKAATEEGLYYDYGALPDYALTVILSCVPDSDLRHCMLVCKRWYRTIKHSTFWKIKCINAGRLLKEIVTIPSTEWRNIYFKNPYGRNLIRNPCGDDGVFREWILFMNGGDGLKVENSDVGCKPKPTEMLEDMKNSTKNFVTSYGWCRRVQVIDLIKEGCSEYVLDTIRPDIEVSEWYTSRWDCSSVWEMRVSLSKKTYKSAEEIESCVSSQYVGYGGYGGGDVFDPTDWGLGKGDTIVATFKFGPQITPDRPMSVAVWEKVSHTFTGYGPGVKSVIFEDASKDTKFWAGHYGGKMSGARVKINMPTK